MRTASSSLGRVGDYRLEQRLGAGGMAEVFVARREGPHGFSKLVAIKRILPQLATDPRIVAMFCDEARIQAALAHPNLVQVFDFGEDQGQPFMALEYVDGLSGSQLVARLAARRRTTDLGPALHIAREVLEALAYLHAATDESGRPLGIVHRDVAPSNILIGSLGQVKLGDFGIVRSEVLDARTVPGELKGKIGYVSPEQAMGRAVDMRSDLFSLGVVLAELLLGGPLFPGSTELEVLESLHRSDLGALDTHGGHIPSDVRAILHKALARWPEQRFQSAAEFAQALDVVARSHGENMDAHALSAWLVDLGLVAVASEVRARQAPTKDAVDALLERSARLSDPPFSEVVTLVPEEIDGALQRLSDALLFVLPENDTASIPGELAHAVRRPRASAHEASPTYRLRAGPSAAERRMPLASALELIATGQLGTEVEVARGEGPWLGLSSVTELSRLAGRAAYRFHDPVAPSARERWLARLEVLPWLVFQLVEDKRTGLLIGMRPGEQVRVYFEEGVPVFSSSTQRQQLLGSQLVLAGAVEPGALDEALESGWRAGRRIGEALIQRGLVSAEAVRLALRAQLEGRLTSLLALREGEVAFVDGVRSGEDPQDLPAREVVAVALSSAVGEAELVRLLAPVEKAGCLAPSARAFAIASQLGDSAEAELLRAIGGRVTLAALCATAPRTLAHRAVLLGLASQALTWTA